jgi:hypothetical protein
MYRVGGNCQTALRAVPLRMNPAPGRARFGTPSMDFPPTLFDRLKTGALSAR